MARETAVSQHQHNPDAELTNEPRPKDQRRVVAMQHTTAGSVTRAGRFQRCLEGSWEATSRRVHARCRRRLARFPGIDPRDVAQEALVQVLRRDFAAKFDARKGTMTSYINGATDMVCRKAVKDWSRRVCRASASDPVAEPGHSFDPVKGAIGNEFLHDLSVSSASLSPRERQSLAYMVDRACGSRPAVAPDARSVYTAASRCRARLRSLLQRHDPLG